MRAHALDVAEDAQETRRVEEGFHAREHGGGVLVQIVGVGGGGGVGERRREIASRLRDARPRARAAKKRHAQETTKRAFLRRSRRRETGNLARREGRER